MKANEPKRERSRVVNVAHSFDDAAEWDIEQQVSMTPEERMLAARELIEAVYGKETKDVRETRIYRRRIRFSE